MATLNPRDAAASPLDVVEASPTGSPLLVLEGIERTYLTRKGPRTALRDLSLSVSARELVCIIGPSGAGKTTLLRTIAGLDAPTSGRAEFEGIPIAGPPRGMAVVFQDYARSLYPWMHVDKNVAFPLVAAGVPRARRTTLVGEALSQVGLSGSEHLYPSQLSGGMQQRVAIARALATKPHLLLMDEPFASVDAQTRGELEDLVLRLARELGFTLLLITHDIDEAIYMADSVVVLGGSPATVRQKVAVNLSHPRDQVHSKADPHFSEVRGILIDLMRRGPAA